MAIQRTRFEQRSTLDAIEDFLTTRGYSGITFTDGYQPETVIAPPHVSVHFPPSGPTSLQLGRIQGQDSFYQRTIVVNAYMENEGRAQGIVDDIIDFFEFECVEIKDNFGSNLGTVQCNNPDGIVGQVFAPIMGNTQNLRWRGSVTAPVDSYYPNL